jgi:hypothetical protein
MEEKKKKGSETSASDINVIEINIAVSSSESLQGLSLTRRFAKGE